MSRLRDRGGVPAGCIAQPPDVWFLGAGFFLRWLTFFFLFALGIFCFLLLWSLNSGFKFSFLKLAAEYT